MGKSRMQAALLGAREISFAAIAATLSIMAIFLPVAFMQGTIGKFFFQFGVTVGVAVFLSLICSLTLTPMLCAYFLPLPGKHNRLPDRYSRVLLALFAACLGVAVVLLLTIGWEAAVVLLVVAVLGLTAGSFIVAKVTSVAPHAPRPIAMQLGGLAGLT